MPICSECIHFKKLTSNKNIGKCTAPLPYYAKLGDVYDYVSTNDVIAELCDCFTGKGTVGMEEQVRESSEDVSGS